MIRNATVCIFGLLVVICRFGDLAYADCQGCCSSHGGVVCVGGVTMCGDGTPLSPTCVAKACDKCGIILPSVFTNPVTAVTATSATLGGQVNPNGTTTTYYFEYGASTNYTSATASQTAVGTGTIAASATIVGLNPNSAYHYRLIATNSSGRTNGNDVSFTTVGGLTNPMGIGASTPSAVRLGGRVLLTIAVTPGANPTSTGIRVTGDLSTIVGALTQQFYDDGTHGDTTSGDNTFSFETTILSGTSPVVPGPKRVSIRVTDDQGRAAVAEIILNILTPPRKRP